MWHAVGIISQEFLCPIAECCLTSGEIKILSSVEHPPERAGELRVSSHSLNCSRIFWVLKCKWHNISSTCLSCVEKITGRKIKHRSSWCWWLVEIGIGSAQRNPETVPGYKIIWNTEHWHKLSTRFLLQPAILYFRLAETGVRRQERGERWHRSHQDIICNTFNIQLFKHTNKYSVKGECSLTIFAVSLVQSTFAVDW